MAFVAGRTRQHLALRLTQGAVAYLDAQSGAGKNFSDRGHMIDWIIRQVRKQRLLGLRKTENLEGASDGAAEARHQISTTLDREEVAWIERSVGPSRQPFLTRAEGVIWCIELACRRGLAPSDDPQTLAAEVRR